MSMKTKLATYAKVAMAAVAAVIPTGCSGHAKDPTARLQPGPHIFSVSTDGSAPRSMNIGGIGLARGPDGRMAFLSGSRLAVMNDDGSDLRVLGRGNSGSEDPVAPAWS